MKSTEHQSRGGLAGASTPMSVILNAPVSTDPETIREYVPRKVRDARWWERTNDEQKATVIRSIICLRMRGFSDAQVAELRTAVFRMFLAGPIADHQRCLVVRDTVIDSGQPGSGKVTPIHSRRSPKNRALREKIERLKSEREFEDLTRQELIDIALHDELTGLPNRHAYEMAKKKPAVAFADLEGLKWINDNIGHAAGDELLKRTADILDEQDLDAFRLGKAADEFIVQFDTVDEADRAMAHANEILKRSPIEAEGRVVTGFQLSCGIAADPETADENMNAAKAELQQAGLRAKRGERPVALQEVVKGVAVSIAPPPRLVGKPLANTGKIVNLRQNTLAFPHRIPTHPAIPATQRRSA